MPYYDILICASSDNELAHRVRAVLTRFKNSGLKLRKEKCILNAKSIDFLSVHIDSTGIRPMADKIKDIQRAPRPKSKKELQSLLGLINYYHTFMEDKANVADPLHRLLDQNKKWKWEHQHDVAFSDVKKLLTSQPILVHYDPRKQLVLACDASPWGVGEVLSHPQEDGTTKPIAFHSRTLFAAERNYSQLDKEALASVTGVKKFHNYLFGHTFQIETDHKPLLGLLRENRPIPELTSPRLVRWAIVLSCYSYQLKYKPGREMGHADSLSRLSIGTSTPLHRFNVLMVENLPEVPLRAATVAQMTNRDAVLSQVTKFIQMVWHTNVPENCKPFKNRQNELSVYRDCVLWGSRVVLPEKARKQALQTLHDVYVGMVRMKAIARSYMWWPRMDADIEQLLRECRTCKLQAQTPARAPLHLWEWPSSP